MRVHTTQQPGARFRAPTALQLSYGLGSGAPDLYPDCERFYRCVGLTVKATGRDRDPLSTYEFTLYSVNGAGGWTSGDICASPTATAQRFGVSWSDAMTQWGRARGGRSCTYVPGDTTPTTTTQPNGGGGQQDGRPGSRSAPEVVPWYEGDPVFKAEQQAVGDPAPGGNGSAVGAGAAGSGAGLDLGESGTIPWMMVVAAAGGAYLLFAKK